MQENSGPLQALTPHPPPCCPALGPMLTASALKSTPLEEFEVLLFSTVRQEGSSQYSVLILSTEIKHWPSCFYNPLPSLRMLCSRQIDHCVPCALYSWNRIWTRYSSIWKKWGSLMCLASVKQQARGNASCATTLKKQPVRDISLTAQNHVCPWA